jgi:arsenite oxidase small subunit
MEHNGLFWRRFGHILRDGGGYSASKWCVRPAVKTGPKEPMERRQFMLGCAAAAAMSPLAARADARPHYYGRARLVDAAGRPIKAAELPPERNFIFHYPFAGTPCFLLNLGKPTRPAAELKTASSDTYRWSGGVGRAHSVVAYSAICAHRMTYPTREISFISYRAERTPQNRFAHVIHCCSEHSQYDPAEGARVVAGPAPQPLAAILLDHDAATDALYAIGTLGGEMFGEFFSKYEFRLTLEHNGHAHDPVRGSCVVSELTEYCRQQVKC